MMLIKHCYSYNVIYCFIYWSKNRITDFHTVALVVPAGPCQLVKDLWPVPWFVSPLSAGRLTNHVFSVCGTQTEAFERMNFLTY